MPSVYFECLSSSGSVAWQIVSLSDGSQSVVCPSGSTLRIVQGLSVQDLFAVPLVDDLQTAFYIGFSLPVICYLSAWAYQKVISFIDDSIG